MTNETTTYEKETLTALYATLDYLKSNDLPCDQVVSAIQGVEAKISNRK